MRRFLRLVADGHGGAVTPLLQHFSVQSAGAGLLLGNNFDSRFDFFGVPSTTLRVMAWVMLQSKPAAAVSTVVAVAEDAAATFDSWGIQYNGFIDRWQMYKSNGVAFATNTGGFSPALNTWYGIAASFNYNSLGFDVYGLGGLIESVSTGLVDNSYNAAGRPLSVFGRSLGDGKLTGRVDSLSVSYSPLGNPAPGGVLFHGGLAPDWRELSASDIASLETIRGWWDFNEPDGASTYRDSSGNNSNLSSNTTGLTRQPGAGY